MFISIDLIAWELHENCIAPPDGTIILQHTSTMAMMRPNVSSMSKRSGTPRRLSEPTYPRPPEKRIISKEKHHSITQNTNHPSSRDQAHLATIDKLSLELEGCRITERNLAHELQVMKNSERVLKASVSSLNEQIVMQMETISRSKSMLSMLPDAVRNLKIIFNETKKMRLDKTTHETTQGNMSDIIADLAEDNYKRLEETAILKLTLSGNKFDCDKQDSVENTLLKGRIQEFAIKERIMSSKIDELERKLIGEHFLNSSLSKSLDEAHATVLILREGKAELFRNIDSLNERIRQQNIATTAATHAANHPSPSKYPYHYGESGEPLETDKFMISRFGGMSPIRRKSHTIGETLHTDHKNYHANSHIRRKLPRKQQNIARLSDISSLARSSSYDNNVMTSDPSDESHGHVKRFSGTQYLPYADSMGSPVKEAIQPVHQSKAIDEAGENDVTMDSIPEATEPTASSDKISNGSIKADLIVADEADNALLTTLTSCLTDATLPTTYQ